MVFDFIDNTNTNPYFNLALEEYFLKQFALSDDLLILWQNEPSIIIGRNQIADDEIYLEIAKSKSMKIVRRLTGGGAVYHDLENLNFTYIMRNDDKQNDYQFFAIPIIDCLSRYGLKANHNGKNDILVDGRKISGNAQCIHQGKLLHHGTILYNTDLEILSKLLKPKKNSKTYEGVTSVRSRVINILELFVEPITLIKLKKSFIDSIENCLSTQLSLYNLTKKEKSAIVSLMTDKYATDNWNFSKQSM